MKDDGYDPEFSCAITAASATIGPIFPRPFPGHLCHALLHLGRSPLHGRNGSCHSAGYFPHDLCRHRGKEAQLSPRREIVWITFLAFTFKALPALLTPVILLVGIYTGVMTPTEAGAIAGLYAILISVFAYKAMGIRICMK
jgi:TRAP-type C4-dicarboxylate transport system permease large subunit